MEVAMTDRGQKAQLTDSLEDYLETVYQLVRDKKFARVKDIARARNVRPGSVSPAMRRLAEMGLIEYVRREYIGLTPTGEERARRIMARHQLLCRLFEDVLQMEFAAAEEEACAMEHSLSDEAMDRLVRFFEFLRVCPEAQDILSRFHGCRALTDELGYCEETCHVQLSQPAEQTDALRVLELSPGQRGRVTQVSGQGKLRKKLLDMGLMPDVVLDIDRVDTVAGTVWVRLGGFEVSLSRKEAEAVMVARED